MPEATAQEVPESARRVVFNDGTFGFASEMPYTGTKSRMHPQNGALYPGGSTVTLPSAPSQVALCAYPSRTDLAA